MAPPNKRGPSRSGVRNQAHSASLFLGMLGKHVREPESLDAPPLSSGEDESDQEANDPRTGPPLGAGSTTARKPAARKPASRKPQARIDLSSDDEGPRSRKADMRETTFRTRAKTTADTLATDAPRRRSTRQQASLRRNQENRPPKRSRRGSESLSLSDPSDVSEPEPNDGAPHFAKKAKMTRHSTDTYGPFCTRNKPINTYGRKSGQGLRHSGRGDLPKFKVWNQDPSPEKQPLKIAFFNPFSSPLSPPPGRGSADGWLTFKKVNERIETPSKRPEFRNPRAALDKSDDEKEEEQGARTRRAEMSKKWSALRHAFASKPEAASPRTEPASFKNPIEMDDGSALSSPEDSALEDDEPELSAPPVSDESTPTPVPTATCPMCGKEVDPGLLDNFSKGKRMPIQIQARFCREHQKTAALSEWSTKKYPDIDWTKLDARLGAQRALLVDIVEKRRASPFARQLEENIHNGIARTLLKTENGLAAPGYYGPRGFTRISEILTRQLGSLLRQRAVSERLISARGTTTFVQTVLVPEAAVRLIMEDMSVDEDDARRIMAQSVKIGELINEDMRQVVRDKAQEDVDAADSELSELSDMSD